MRPEACIYSQYDKDGNANADAGKFICIKPPESEWSALERGIVASNLCVITLTDIPQKLCDMVSGCTGSVAYPFAVYEEYEGEYFGLSQMIEISSVRVPAEQSNSGETVSVNDCEGIEEWLI